MTSLATLRPSGLTTDGIAEIERIARLAHAAQGEIGHLFAYETSQVLETTAYVFHVLQEAADGGMPTADLQALCQEHEAYIRQMRAVSTTAATGIIASVQGRHQLVDHSMRRLLEDE